MSKLRALIVDDERNNIANLSLLLEKYCPQIVVAGTAINATEARKLIAASQPDLIFLDVQMPGESGFDLLQSLPEIDFGIIFVTAYDQYGIQAIKMSALDYLLKPVSITDLVNAVEKAEKQLHQKRQQEQLQNLLRFFNTETNKRQQKLALPTLNETRLVNISDIVRCESSNSYTTFFLLHGEKIIVSRAIREYEELLHDYGFIRVHQSHLVNKVFIESFSKKDGFTLLMKDGSMVPVARQKKDHVLESLNIR